MKSTQLKRNSEKTMRSETSCLGPLPVICPGVTTQLDSNSQLIVIDLRNERAFRLTGVAAKIWIMLEQGSIASQVETAVFKNFGPKFREKRAKEVSVFFQALAALKLTESFNQ